MEVYVTPRLEARCPIGRSGDFFIHPKFNSTQKRKEKSRKEKRKAELKTFAQLRENLSALCVK